MKKSDLKNIRLVSDGIELTAGDGSLATLSFSDFPRLNQAEDSLRKDFSVGDFGLRWESLDEDISFDSIFYPERYPLKAKL